MKRTFKKSELIGQRGYTFGDVGIRLFPLAVWEDGSPIVEMDEAMQIRVNDHGTVLTGEPLVAALRERGVEVVEDVACEKIIAGLQSFKKELEANAKPVESDKWAHLPEGGEWFTSKTGKPELLWHYPQEGRDTGTWYEADGRRQNNGGQGACVYPGDKWDRVLKKLSRAEAIAIFEAKAKPEVDEWGTFSDLPVYHRIGDTVTIYYSDGSLMRESVPWKNWERTRSAKWRPLTPAEVEAFKAKIAAYGKPEVKPTETPATSDTPPFSLEAIRTVLQWCEDRRHNLHAYRVPHHTEYYYDFESGGSAYAGYYPTRNAQYIVQQGDWKPATSPTEADQLRKELDEAKATINRLRDSLTKAENDRPQPPMSDERFLQEASIAAMAAIVGKAPHATNRADDAPEFQTRTRGAVNYATALLSALRKEQ